MNQKKDLQELLLVVAAVGLKRTEVSTRLGISVEALRYHEVKNTDYMAAKVAKILDDIATEILSAIKNNQ